MGSRKINELMPIVREAIQPAVLGRKIIDVRFLTTQTDDALIALAYNRDLKGCKEFTTEEWQDAAQDLHQKTGATVVGRSRKFKVVVGSDDDTVTEKLEVNGRALTYAQQEGAFTQPNAGVCEKMLAWAHDATLGSKGDLCELYCGGGTFTVALAPNFERVVATELSKASVALAERNLATNAVENVRVARVPAEEVAAALKTGTTPRRLQNLDVDLSQMGRGSLFVDPPRAGLDETCSQIAGGLRPDHLRVVQPRDARARRAPARADAFYRARRRLRPVPLHGPPRVRRRARAASMQWVWCVIYPGAAPRARQAGARRRARVVAKEDLARASRAPCLGRSASVFSICSARNLAPPPAGGLMSVPRSARFRAALFRERRASAPCMSPRAHGERRPRAVVSFQSQHRSKRASRTRNARSSGASARIERCASSPRRFVRGAATLCPRRRFVDRPPEKIAQQRESACAERSSPRTS